MSETAAACDTPLRLASLRPSRSTTRHVLAVILIALIHHDLPILESSNAACDSLDGSLQFRVRTLAYGTGEENVEATERTRDDSSKTTQLKALAAPYRFRVTVDAEGLPMIPGRYGRIEWHCDGVNCSSCALPRRLALAIHTDHPRVFQKLWAIPGVMRHQTGDTEMRAVFVVELLGKVASVIRAKRWGGSGRGRSENFTLTSGQPATSRRSQPRNVGSQG
jgi:hypothetical protein